MPALFRPVLLAALVLAGACAGVPQRTDEQRYAAERYLRYASGSISSFNYFGRFDGWKPLGHQRLMVWDGVDRAFLLTVEPPCHELDHAGMISFQTTVRGMVTSRLDAVRFPNGRCRITDIQRIDYARMKRDEKASEED